MVSGEVDRLGHTVHLRSGIRQEFRLLFGKSIFRNSWRIPLLMNRYYGEFGEVEVGWQKNVRQKTYPDAHLFLAAHLSAIQIIEQNALIDLSN